jgi:hypothetical protein
MTIQTGSSWAKSSFLVLACAGSALGPGITHAADAEISRDLALRGGELSFQPQASDSTAAQTSDAPPAVAEYASAESKWWTLGIGAAYDFDGSTDIPLRGAYSYFLGDGVEFSLELDGWYFAQEGPDAVGASISTIFRWHFYRKDPWTAYIDAGIGVMGASDEVPDGGTQFNFLPQAGAGVTRRLNDRGLRLQLGLRWHHISNARSQGDDENPDRDAPMLYGGLIFPF